MPPSRTSGSTARTSLTPASALPYVSSPGRNSTSRPPNPVVRPPTNTPQAGNSPVTSVDSDDIRCNASPSAASGLCDVSAGDTIAVEMHEQPGDRDCDNPAIGGNHYGPVMVYLSAVDDAASADGSDPWFKIGEFGYDTETDTWGTDVLNENCGQFEATIPADLPEGDYLLRAEAIALHTAAQAGGAQFYMSCFVSFPPFLFGVLVRGMMLC